MEPTHGGVGEQPDRHQPDRVGHARHGPQLGPQLGGARRMVGAGVEGVGLGDAQVVGDPGVALGTGLLGERVIGHLAHDVAAEPPAQAVEHQHACRFQLLDVARLERLLQGLGEVAK